MTTDPRPELRHEWCTCNHSYAAHECGCCQVAIGEYRTGSPKHCDCRAPEDDDD